MLTETQREIFSRLLDKNYEANRERDGKKSLELHNEVAAIQKELKDSMGEEAFQAFMDKGRKMFA